MAHKTSFKIFGTGHYLPNNLVYSTDLDAKLGLTPGVIERKSGVSRRCFVSENENAAEMGAKAATLAVQEAGLTLSDIDCIVACSATMDQGLPCNAALLHEALGLGHSGIPALDVNASCLGFVAAIDMLRWQLAHERYKRVLLVASDIASCGLNWENLESSAIFADGAAAAVVGPAGDNSTSGILASKLATWSSGAHVCEIPAGGSRYHPSRIPQGGFEPLTKFHMNGKKVFRLAAEHFDEFLAVLLDEAGVTMSDIDLIVPHQASQLGLQHMVKRLNISPSLVVNIFSEYGNQVAASLPTALDVAVQSKRIKRGQTVLLIGTGAGLSIGGVVMEY